VALQLDQRCVQVRLEPTIGDLRACNVQQARCNMWSLHAKCNSAVYAAKAAGHARATARHCEMWTCHSFTVQSAEDVASKESSNGENWKSITSAETIECKHQTTRATDNRHATGKIRGQHAMTSCKRQQTPCTKRQTGTRFPPHATHGAPRFRCPPNHTSACFGVHSLAPPRPVTQSSVSRT
jgi:hypothetical protein